MKECEDEEGLRDTGVVKSLSTLKVRRRICIGCIGEWGANEAG